MDRTPSNLDRPIAYLDRIRRYYLTLGYDTPYRWAHRDDVPFQNLAKPLNQCRVALVTTAARYDSELGDQGPGSSYNAAAKFYTVYSEPIDGNTDVRISHLGYDRSHTSAEDCATWFPLGALRRGQQAGLIGSLAPRFHGLPTNRSQDTTTARDAPMLLQRLEEDLVDVALLVPNCPVCHQCCALAACHLEAAGIATVVMGCARDIVEYVGVPRLLFSDFPLGNGAGKPGDPDSQDEALRQALELLTTAGGPRTTRVSPLRWSEDAEWKSDFYNVDRLSKDEVARLRADFDRQKRVARERRRAEGVAGQASN
jgi:glycine/betaine/sarcosine/D-proline reductase family selenoprotein B